MTETVNWRFAKRLGSNQADALRFFCDKEDAEMTDEGLAIIFSSLPFNTKVAKLAVLRGEITVKPRPSGSDSRRQTRSTRGRWGLDFSDRNFASPSPVVLNSRVRGVVPRPLDRRPSVGIPLGRRWTC